MCQMCSDLNGRETCPDCGREICFDLADTAAGPTRAYATLAGNLYCTADGSLRDQADMAEEHSVYFPEDDDI